MAAPLAFGAAVGVGCGSSDDGLSAEQVASVKRETLREVKAQQRQQDADRKLRELERELKQLKRKRPKKESRPAASSGGGGGGGGGTPAPTSSGSACGGGISVNSVTSCSFAANVAAAFYDHGPGTVYATSPVTGQTYAMSCSGGVPTTCTGGNGAAVYIR